MAVNNNILYLDNYRKLSQARTEPVDKKGGHTPPDIFCGICDSHTLVVVGVTKEMMVVKCTNCLTPKVYILNQTPVL
jgi:hypothetical protein